MRSIRTNARKENEGREEWELPGNDVDEADMLDYADKTNSDKTGQHCTEDDFKDVF